MVVGPIEQHSLFLDLPEQLGRAVAALELFVPPVSLGDPAALAELRTSLPPTVERAAALKGEYEACRERFGDLLNRLGILDLDRFRKSPGYLHLEDLVEDAQRIRQDIEAGIRQMGEVPVLLEQLTPEHFAAGDEVWFSLVLQRHTEGPTQILRDLHKLQERMDRFLAQARTQQNPAQLPQRAG